MSTEKMNSKERILTTMKGEIPDRVPVQLGITNMFSVKQQNLIGWDIYAHHKVPLWKVVTDTHRKYGLDGYLYLGLKTINPDVETSTQLKKIDDRKIIRRTTISTPEGELFKEDTILKNETPSTTTGLIKDKNDFEIYLKYCLNENIEYSDENLLEPIEYLGEDGVAAGMVGIPGLASLSGLFDGKLEKATYFCFDNPDLIEKYREKSEKLILKKIERMLDTDLDYIQLGSSGMLTLSTPEYYRQLSLPTIKKATALCKEGGVLTELHCCGFEKLVIETCYHETDLDSINPLQPPPMGDCDLAEIKEKYGDKLCLKGNVGVTFPLLRGTPQDVEKAVENCMNAAKENGRYILFSEEGISADTPDENVRRYVETGKRLGIY